MERNFTTGSGADLLRPAVVESNPPNGATDVPRDTVVTLTFNEPLNPLSVDENTVTLSGVEAAVELDATRTVVTIRPAAPLGANRRITVRADVLDRAGNIDTLSAIVFTTGAN